MAHGGTGAHSTNMARQRETAGGEAAEGDIRRVLDAEHEARRAVERARTRADAIMEDARRQARMIAVRADQRIARLYQRSREATDRRIEQLQAEGEREERRVAAAEPDPTALTAAVERVARRLAGAEDGEP